MKNNLSYYTSYSLLPDQATELLFLAPILQRRKLRRRRRRRVAGLEFEPRTSCLQAHILRHPGHTVTGHLSSLHSPVEMAGKGAGGRSALG